MKNQADVGKNSTNLPNSKANFWANLATNLKTLFTLPKWLKIFLSVLSVVAVAGVIGTYALMSWANGKVETVNLTFNGIDKGNKEVKASENAYSARVHFERLDVLLRSKVIAYIDIKNISWVSQVDESAVRAIKSQNRYIKFISTQNLQALNTQNLGEVKFTMDFSPLLKTIVKYYVWIVILTFFFCSIFLCRIVMIKNKKVQILLLVLTFMAMSSSFYGNIFGIVSNGWFKNFQLDDQAHVIGKILADKNKIDTKGYGLGLIQAQGYNDTFGIQSSEILEKGVIPQAFFPYTSTLGIQGYAWSFIYDIFNNIELKYSQTHLKDLKPLNLICSLLSAFVILVLSFLLGKIFGKLFGIVFLFSMFLSPWVNNFAHHTFYVLFLWLTPSIFGFWIFLYLQNNTYKTHKKAVILLIFAYFVSMFVVSLTHYHFLTSIVLFSLSPFLIAPFLSKINTCNCKISTKTAFKFFIVLFIFAILSTLIVLIIHGFIRGNGDLLEGLKIMYEKDFLRRMVGGSANNFHPAVAQSLNASIFEVILKYFNWNSPIIVGLEFKGNFYALLILDILLLIFVFKGIQKKLLIVMLIVFALPAISWFVFGKAQSYIHTHMNFILWYFGFIATLLYIPILTISNKYDSLNKEAIK